jgi:hypothetical protein
MHKKEDRLGLLQIRQRINDGSADLRELYQSLHERLIAMRADGDEVPADASEVEHQLELEMVAESQGR